VVQSSSDGVIAHNSLSKYASHHLVGWLNCGAVDWRRVWVESWSDERRL